MLKIETVESCLVDLPTIRPHVLAMATMMRQTLCIVRIRCSDGVVGIGEATTIGGMSYGPESPEDHQAGDRHLFRATPARIRSFAGRP